MKTTTSGMNTHLVRSLFHIRELQAWDTYFCTFLYFKSLRLRWCCFCSLPLFSGFVSNAYLRTCASWILRLRRVKALWQTAGLLHRSLKRLNRWRPCICASNAATPLCPATLRSSSQKKKHLAAGQPSTLFKNWTTSPGKHHPRAFTIQIKTLK